MACRLPMHTTGQILPQKSAPDRIPGIATVTGGCYFHHVADPRRNLQVAIRVLKAISVECVPPSPSDAQKLRKLAESDSERQIPLDQLACDVISRERNRIA